MLKVPMWRVMLYDHLKLLLWQPDNHAPFFNSFVGVSFNNKYRSEAVNRVGKGMSRELYVAMSKA